MEEKRRATSIKESGSKSKNSITGLCLLFTSSLTVTARANIAIEAAISRKDTGESLSKLIGTINPGLAKTAKLI